MSKRKLLLADDSITIQKVVNLTFADEGIEVISVGDGDSAMRKFDEFIPDLVMADVNMPGLNGYEVCRIIKRTEETQNIPVILLVGSFEPFDESEAKDAGADDFLTKPFQSIRQLVNKVTELLNQSKRAPETPQSEAPESAPPPVDTFAETLQFEKRPEATESEYQSAEIGSEYGDAGMDDEMIETSPANDYISDSEYQSDTTETDYAKTQPLNAEDLKGFHIIPGTAAEPEPDAAGEAAAERTEETSERAEAASFDEEARKLGDGYEETGQEENREVISETEPEIDYYLPAGDEEENREVFEEQVSDAETLEPEVSYATEEPREADFSQAPAEESSDAETAVEASSEAETEVSASLEPEETAPSSINEYEYAGYYKTDTADESEAESAARSEEFTETAPAEAISDEDARAGAFDDSAADTAEYAASDLTVAPEAEEAQFEEAETAEESPLSATDHAPSLNFDDGDLLELPPLVEETGIRPQPKLEAVAPAEPELEPATAETPDEPETGAAETEESPAVSEAASAFPPELIEAIAQKVAEKISAKTLNDVLPQITELVMKKLAEENQKNEK